MSKKIIVLQLIVIVFTFNVSAQKDTNLISSNSREVWYEPAPEGMDFIPQGSFTFKNDTGEQTITVPSFWMSNEITNKEYRDFINYATSHPLDTLKWNNWETVNGLRILSGENIVIYAEIMNEIDVDILVLAGEYKSDTVMFNKYKNYFYDKEFDKFPVVGVSYTGAFYYCLWKTTKERKENKDFVYKADYRIPYAEEWLYAASLCEKPKENSSNEIKDVKYYKQGKKFKICNLTANVSEWTSTCSTEKDSKFVLGSSWKENSSDEMKKSLNINTRSSVVGFRIVRSYIGNR